MINMLDLFTGIMGFSLAASWTGKIQTVACSEIDPFCCELIKKRMPNVPNLGDIKNHEKWDVSEPIDIVTGGFPCQPFSIAGKRRGTKDDRWLWKEMFGVIKKFKPTWVIGENVTGLINMGLDQTCTDLESEGYEVQPLIIPACAVNAWHRRDRVWIIAYSKSKRWNNMGTFKMGVTTEDSQQKRKQLESFRFEITGYYYVQLQTGDVDRICRDHNVLPSEVDRLKSLGNAIIPQIAFELLNGIVNINREIATDRCRQEVLL